METTKKCSLNMSVALIYITLTLIQIDTWKLMIWKKTLGLNITFIKACYEIENFEFIMIFLTD